MIGVWWGRRTAHATSRLRYCARGLMRWSYGLPFSSPGWLDREVRLEILHRQRPRESLLASLGRRCLARVRLLLGQVTQPLGALAVTLLANVALILSLGWLVPRMPLGAVHWDEYMSDLWQVHAAILGVTLVVVVLLVEKGAKDALSDDVFEYIIADSNIVPVVVFGLTQVGVSSLIRLAVDQSVMVTQQAQAACLASLVMFMLYLVLTAGLYRRTLKYLAPAFFHRAVVALLSERSSMAAHGAYAHMLGQRHLSGFCRDHRIYMKPGSATAGAT